MESPGNFSGSIRFDLFHIDCQGVFPQHQAGQKRCGPHEQLFEARGRPLKPENAGRAVPAPPPAAQPCQVAHSHVGLLQSSLLKNIAQNPEPFSKQLWLKRFRVLCFVLFFARCYHKMGKVKQQASESFESAADFDTPYVVDRGAPPYFVTRKGF